MSKFETFGSENYDINQENYTKRNIIKKKIPKSVAIHDEEYDNQTKIRDFVQYGLSHFSILDLRYLNEQLVSEGLISLNKMEKVEESDFQCGVCLSTPKDITVTKCGHMFCTKCIKKWFEENQYCPLCQKSLTRKDLIHVHKDVTETFEEIEEIPSSNFMTSLKNTVGTPKLIIILLFVFLFLVFSWIIE